MNQAKAAMFLPLITAMAEGKTIQLRVGGSGASARWIDKPQLEFSGLLGVYRIKPEPRTFYIAVNKNPALAAHLVNEVIFDEKSNYHNFEYIKVVEVLPS